jgi:hypothetical protein
MASTVVDAKTQKNRDRSAGVLADCGGGVSPPVNPPNPNSYSQPGEVVESKADHEPTRNR